MCRIIRGYLDLGLNGGNYDQQLLEELKESFDNNFYQFNIAGGKINFNYKVDCEDGFNEIEDIEKKINNSKIMKEKIIEDKKIKLINVLRKMGYKICPNGCKKQNKKIKIVAER